MAPIEDVVDFILSMEPRITTHVLSGMILVASLAYEMTTTDFRKILYRDKR
jgi:hypothetical protein